MVTVNELISGVNILLGSAALAQCPRADCTPPRRGLGQLPGAGRQCRRRGLSRRVDADRRGAGHRRQGRAVRRLHHFRPRRGRLRAVGVVPLRHGALVPQRRDARRRRQAGRSGTATAPPTRPASSSTARSIRPTSTARSTSSGSTSAAASMPARLRGAHTEIIREGAAWVGALGAEGRRRGRHGRGRRRLAAPQEVRPGPLRLAAHPGDSFSYDIFSQAGQAIRDRAGIAPLDGLPVQRIIGTRRVAVRLPLRHLHQRHPPARRGVYDGYLVHSRGGLGAPLSEAPQEEIPVPGTAPIRDDLDVPTLIFETETDLTFLGYSPPASPTASAVRTWEVAGTSHVDTYTHGQRAPATWAIRSTSPSCSSPPNRSPACLTCSQPINSGPQHFVLNAAVAALERWVPRRDAAAGLAAPGGRRRTAGRHRPRRPRHRPRRHPHRGGGRAAGGALRRSADGVGSSAPCSARRRRSTPRPSPPSMATPPPTRPRSRHRPPPPSTPGSSSRPTPCSSTAPPRTPRSASSPGTAGHTQKNPCGVWAFWADSRRRLGSSAARIPRRGVAAGRARRSVAEDSIQPSQGPGVNDPVRAVTPRSDRLRHAGHAGADVDDRAADLLQEVGLLLPADDGAARRAVRIGCRSRAPCW